MRRSTLKTEPVQCREKQQSTDARCPMKFGVLSAHAKCTQLLSAVPSRSETVQRNNRRKWWRCRTKRPAERSAEIKLALSRTVRNGDALQKERTASPGEFTASEGSRMATDGCAEMMPAMQQNDSKAQQQTVSLASRTLLPVRTTPPIARCHYYQSGASGHVAEVTPRACSLAERNAATIRTLNRRTAR